MGPHTESSAALMPRSSSQQSGLLSLSDSEAFATPRSEVESIATSAGFSPRSMSSFRTPGGRSRSRGGDAGPFGGLQDGLELRSLEASRRQSRD